MPTFIDTVAWVCLENGRILCVRPHGRDVDRLLFDDLKAGGELR